MQQLIKSLLNNRKIWVSPWPTFIWAALILILSVLPAPDDKPVYYMPYIDKMAHIVFYGVLALVSSIWLSVTHVNIQMWKVKLFFSVIIYGAFIELIQHFFTGHRQFEWLDIVSNAIGAMLTLSLTKFGKIFVNKWLV